MGSVGAGKVCSRVLQATPQQWVWTVGGPSAHTYPQGWGVRAGLSCTHQEGARRGPASRHPSFLLQGLRAPDCYLMPSVPGRQPRERNRSSLEREGHQCVLPPGRSAPTRACRGPPSVRQGAAKAPLGAQRPSRSLSRSEDHSHLGRSLLYFQRSRVQKSTGTGISQGASVSAGRRTPATHRCWAARISGFS